MADAAAAKPHGTSLLAIEMRGAVLTIGLDRPAKRNALNDGLIAELEATFTNLPEATRCVVIHGIGDHFSAGLDLSELTEHDATGGLLHSQMWHRAFDRIQYCRVPVIAALKGAVIGGGLEMACAAHIRVAEPSAYFALPEGQRGIFVGGGGSVRLPRLIGVARMMDMMLTGRVYQASEGAAYGFTQYLTEQGGSLTKAMELAEKITTNAPLTNFAVLQALPMIAEGQSADRSFDGVADGDGGAERQGGESPHSRLPRSQDRQGQTRIMSVATSSSPMPAASAISRASAAPLRPIAFSAPNVAITRRADGTIDLKPNALLPAFPDRITDRLHHWADAAPDRIFMAERTGDGWRSVTYANLLKAARSVASALLARGVSAERPVLILSGNSIDHALVAFGALYAGVPFCPVSPAYSLVSKDFGKLRHVVKLLTPGLVYADDADAFAPALTACIDDGIEIAASRGAIGGRRITPLAELMATPEAARLDDAHAAIAPNTVAKFLLTSGSTGLPKAVVNTQAMICANQVMIRETMAFLKAEPPVIVDWLPWNHTFGGNHNIGLTLYNGGSMYLDEGKPTPAGIGETVRNLREIAPTVYFNVPKGFESLLAYLRDDAVLRKNFFSRLQANFFSGAALADHIWKGLDEVAVQETGARVPMLTGLGATETAPYFMAATPLTSRSGHVGLPVVGNAAKLVPNNGKLELRAKGPNVMPGYWRQDELNAKVFDDEGYYSLGDALRPADPHDLHKGFDFDGRVTEDFKLGSGTWVSVGPLRTRFIAATAPLTRDVVIAGINRDELSALVILDPDGCRAINPQLNPADMAALAADPAVCKAFRERLTKFVALSTGSSTRIARALLLPVPLSIDAGEVTDKGSVNQRAVLEHRAALVASLYSDRLPAEAIVIDTA